MAITFDSFKSLRADISGNICKGWNLKVREVCGKMFIGIDRNDKNGRSTLLTNIGWRKENKRNILNFIFEIKNCIFYNGDFFKEAYKKFSNQSEYIIAFKGELSVCANSKKVFLDSKNNLISSTLYGPAKRVKLGCRFLEKSLKPQNVKNLFLKIKENCFDLA